VTQLLVGCNYDQVVRLLRSRRDSGYAPASLADGRKLALIVEGGGMRGVLSAGSLFAIDQMGFRGCFDEIYATSAGAVNAAYFLSGQGALGITVYFDDICCRRFVNPLRLSKIVDVDYVYDCIVRERKRLDEDAIRRAATPLFFSVTDVARGVNVLIDARRAPDPISLVLKASSALPVLYNRVVRLQCGSYVDGGISNSLPVQDAIDAGCTDILVLATKLREHVHGSPSLLHRALMFAMMGWRHPAVMQAHRCSFEVSNKHRRLAAGKDSVIGVNIATLCPETEELVIGKATISRPKLLKAARSMAHRAIRVFGGDVKTTDAAFDQFTGIGSLEAQIAG
jgi:predicted patatin/cPLA2 family phospholipase